MKALNQENSQLAAEIKKETLSPSSSTGSESESAQLGSSPSESGDWLIFGIPEHHRIALLRATVSSLEWQASPHSLRLNTQQDGVIVLDISDLDSASGRNLWEGLVAGSVNGAQVPFEVLPES